MFFENINYIVVIAATAVGIMIGFIWHSPWAFGNIWKKSQSWGEDKLIAKKAGKSMLPVWAVTAASTLVTAIVIAALFNSLVVTSIAGMIVLALSVWVAFVLPIKLFDVIFGGDNWTFFLVSIGHELLVVLAMTLVIGIWG
ncbi:MAG TPA: DUF1761 domain-containing protein [Candidatus Paceibacterota bacterium]|nr:DUF1761 domain-containing protein [Candidatus Paceibacterota bacterium]